MSGVDMTGTGTRRSGQSTTEQAKEKVQETTQRVEEKAGELKGQAGGRLRSMVDERTTTAGSQLRTTAGAMRRTGEQLRSEGKQSEASLVEGVAERAERLGGYMTNVNADRLLRDVEDFGRRQPWLLAAGGAVIGLVASRFLKASSGQRYASGSSDGYPALPYRASSGYGGLSAADLDAPSSREAHGEPEALVAVSPSAAGSGTTSSQGGGPRGNPQ